MNKLNAVLNLSLSALLAAGAAATSTTAAAAANDNMEQCAGVVKAGMNDCATSHNACHGHATANGDSEAWIYLPKGTCAKIAGARVVKVVDPTPASKR